MTESSTNNGFGFNDLLPDDIKQDVLKVEEKIETIMSIKPLLIEKIGRHVLGSGGKRLRPIMHLLASRFCEYDGRHSISIAAITELLHTATLLHDDVIDSSLTRRGKPSANVLWGNKASILVGDYIFSQCMDLLVSIENQSINKSFSSVFKELSVGEMLELVNEHNLDVSLEEYFEIIEKKTSSLFKVCMETATMLTDKGKELNGSLSDFGSNFGITFQLIDDYLDYFGDNEKMGKPTMGDFKEKKVTFPLIHLFKVCSEKERQGVKETFYQLNIHEEEELYIKRLMEKYGIDRIILDHARDYNDKAYKNLARVEDSPYKKALLNILEYNISRDR